MSNSMRHWIRVVGGSISTSMGRNLSSNEAEAAFTELLEGGGQEGQVAALFTVIRGRGASADELAGFAKAARKRISFPAMPPGSVVVATTRLGKFHSPSLGLAAVAAAAAAGATVILQAAPMADGGVPTLGDLWKALVGTECLAANQVTEQLEHRLVCWCPLRSDPGWERLLRIEEEVGLRSVPDQVSKLVAPSEVPLLLPSMAGPVLGMAGDALAALGHRSSIILQGAEGSIDPFCSTRTRGMLIEEGSISPLRLDPQDFGLDWPDEPKQRHEDRLEAGKEAIARALMGIAPEAYVAQLGAALILKLAGVARDIATGATMARAAIDDGSAYRKIYDVPKKKHL
jgi:anthranilate phosphoribosyltransferase